MRLLNTRMHPDFRGRRMLHVYGAASPYLCALQVVSLLGHSVVVSRFPENDFSQQHF